MIELEVSNQLAALIGQVLEVQVDPSARTAKLVDDLGANSMDTVEIVEWVETQYGVTIHDEEIGQLVSFTFGDLVALVAHKIKRRRDRETVSTM